MDLSFAEKLGRMSNVKDKLSREIIRKYLGKIAWRRATKIQQRGNFDEKYPEDSLLAFLVAGNQYFDREILIARKRELIGFKPYQSFSNGDARIFFQRVPNRRYLIAVDCATGRQVTTEDTDYTAAVVIDLETGEEVAAYRARVTPQDAAYDVADLGRYFNDAVAAVERTGDGGTCILTLQGDCGYGNVYKHRDWVKRRKKVIGENAVMVDVEGFPTTPKTRPLALNFLNRFLLEHPERIWDEQFINEALVFVRDEKGKPQAAKGAHDDTVSARWIAYYVRLVLLGYVIPWEIKSEGYISADRMVGTAVGA